MEGETSGRLAHRAAVSPDYFGVMGMRVLAGRTFEALEMPGETAIVSASFEREIAQGSAVGKQIVLMQGQAARPFRVVGVVADVRSDHGEGFVPAVYVPLVLFSHFVVRVDGDPASALPMIRQSLSGSDAHVVITRSTTMGEVLATELADEAFRAALSAIFGGVALLLSLVAINALVVRWVADRRRELGIRIALGATAANVRSLVLRQAGIAVAFRDCGRNPVGCGCCPDPTEHDGGGRLGLGAHLSHSSGRDGCARADRRVEASRSRWQDGPSRSLPPVAARYPNATLIDGALLAADA
jgi:hypothetical protein